MQRGKELKKDYTCFILSKIRGREIRILFLRKSEAEIRWKGFEWLEREAIVVLVLKTHEIGL